MTDLRSALRAAAPQPVRALDMAAVHRRARRRGARRIVAWITGAGAALALGVGVSDGVIVPAGRSGGRDADRVVPHPTPTDFESSTFNVDSADRRERTGSEAEPAATTAPIERAPARDEYTVADDCSVTTAGLAIGESRACSFTARGPGGASISSDAPATSNKNTERFASGAVYVTRDGRRSLAWRSDNCGVDARVGDTTGVFAGSCNTQFIQAGDLVEVLLTKKGDDGFVVTLGAGKDW